MGWHVSSEAVSPTALGEARKALGLGPFETLHQLANEKHRLLHAELDLYKGYRLYAVDGSNLNLHSSEALADEFGRPSSTGEKKARPQASFVTLNLVNTGWIVNYQLDHCNKGELTMAKAVTGSLGVGDLLLGDRLYFHPAWYADLIERSVRFLFRVNNNRYKSFTEESKQKLQQMREQGGNIDCPVELTVKRKGYETTVIRKLRYIEVKVTNDVTLRLLTNLTSEEVTVEEAVCLYALRWEIETDYRYFKGPDHLEVILSRLPETVAQEVQFRIIAYNTIRFMQSQACLQNNEIKSHEIQPQPIIQESTTAEPDSSQAEPPTAPNASWKAKYILRNGELRPMDLQFNVAAELTVGLLMELLFFPHNDHRKTWDIFLSNVAAAKIMAKPGRSFPRRARKYNKGKPNKGNVSEQRKRAKKRKQTASGET